MRPEVPEEYRHTVCTLAQWCGHFTLHTGIPPLARLEEEFLPVLESAIWPLVRFSRECWVYNIPLFRSGVFSRDPRASGSKTRTRRGSGMQREMVEVLDRLAGHSPGVAGLRPFAVRRGSEKSARPVIGGNLTGILDRSAIRFAKRRTQAEGTLALGLQYNSGLQFPTFFASEATTRELVEQAFETAQITEGYVALAQGPRPPLREEIKSDFPWLLDRLENERHEET